MALTGEQLHMALQQFDYQPGPCLRSGLCCKTAPCTFGEWDAARKQCRFLEVAETYEKCEIYSCGKKAEIEALPAWRGAAINPAFGQGCCMPLFNANRRAIANHQKAIDAAKS
jgi:hypothetical protein